MVIEKIIGDLESNMTLENEEAKRKLVELLSQNKEQWVVKFMLDYFFTTGSQRILEVLVKAQAPHDGYIFDKLDDCLKQSQHRVQSLQVFCFIVRHHPTWLYKIEKHRLIKSVFKLMTHEKEIVPLMSALLCIITLLPIIPNSVPNFLNDLFEVFGHLASWKLQNSNKLPDEKLVHLQLGLQMLFHRLYGMYPCSFIAYLVEFIKRGNGGGIFQHTIKPLLNTVRVHPMLVTATPETEVNNTRWKEMEPHDVVMECANLSLPVLLPETSNEDGSYAYPMTPGYSRMTSNTSNTDYSYQLREFQQSRNVYTRFDSFASGDDVGPIWSPHNEIATTSSGIPLTPTTSFILPLQPAMNSQLMVGMTGSSPPEAAVEATPETTPLKDMRDIKQPGRAVNSHAVRAIFAVSHPSSPMRKDQQSQFSFPDVSREAEESSHSYLEVNRGTAYDRRLSQVIQDRHNVERSVNTPCPSSLPEINSDLSLVGGSVYPSVTQEVAAVCGECNETDRNLCSVGGLHMPTSRSMHQLAKKRRNRMASYSGNGSCADSRSSAAKKASWSTEAENPMRRTKSCSALSGMRQQHLEENDDEADCSSQRQRGENGNTQKTGSRLQRSGRNLAISAPKDTARSCTHASTQTVEGLDSAPAQYENWLIELLLECKEQRIDYERNLLYPQDILDEYIKHAIKANESFDAEQGQLMCLQLEYESYRRSIHAERNRRLMGRSRDKRSLEMERDRLREQLKNFDAKNKDLANKMDQAIRLANERQNIHQEELGEMRAKYQHELEEKKCLRQANDDLQTRLTSELARHKEMNYELESLRGQVFSLGTELQHTQQQADIGLQCKQELARLEAEFIIMGEVQVRCRDRLAEIDNFRARDEELQMLQESSNLELKDLRHSLDEKTSQLESMKHKISDLQAQLANSEKAMTEQKRLLSTVKDEYEEKFKSVNKKYDVQKKIIMQMEEKLMMMMQQPQGTTGHNTCSPDTDRTDIASSIERNSPLSTSLASSESLSASLRSTELKNLHQLVDTPTIPDVLNSMAGGAQFEDEVRPPAVDLASSASTASAINIVPHALDLPSTSGGIGHTLTHPHPHPHLHLQQQQQDQLQ
uniref:Tuberous sclerosis gene product-1 homolog n=1 Tax=Drosophila melanogaster TaxID=7227 RepID=Q9U9A9_DROME|nr:tuberous sclerosis gene product-1 homolog [Drosophila melanogaster]